MQIDKQAAKGDIASTIEKRATERFGVPIKVNARRYKYHDERPESWDFLAAKADLRYDLSGDLSHFLPRCQDQPDLSKAFGIMEALGEKENGKKVGQAEFALYLIQAEDDPIVKIGVSHMPRLRLQSLQSANYRKLAIWAVLFSPDKKAMQIEQRVLEWASEQGIRLCGEWIAADPMDVFMQALIVARDSRIAVCDAGVWTHNLLERTKRLARSPRVKFLRDRNRR